MSLQGDPFFFLRWFTTTLILGLVLHLYSAVLVTVPQVLLCTGRDQSFPNTNNRWQLNPIFLAEKFQLHLMVLWCVSIYAQCCCSYVCINLITGTCNVPKCCACTMLSASCLDTKSGLYSKVQGALATYP